METRWSCCGSRVQVLKKCLVYLSLSKAPNVERSPTECSLFRFMTERESKNTPSSWETVSMAAVTMVTARLHVKGCGHGGIHPGKALQEADTREDVTLSRIQEGWRHHVSRQTYGLKLLHAKPSETWFHDHVSHHGEKKFNWNIILFNAMWQSINMKPWYSYMNSFFAVNQTNRKCSQTEMFAVFQCCSFFFKKLIPKTSLCLSLCWC